MDNCMHQKVFEIVASLAKRGEAVDCKNKHSRPAYAMSRGVGWNCLCKYEWPVDTNFNLFLVKNAAGDIDTFPKVTVSKQKVMSEYMQEKVPA
jgi:hypothetical protein